MNAIQTVKFHDQNLITTKNNGVYYVAMKPICENIGLDWEAQRQRISRDEVLSSTACMIKVVATDNKIRELLCLPIQYLNGWLFGVDISRVKAEIKDKLITYKKECYQALYDYWHNKPVTQKPLSGAEYLLQMAQQMVEQERRLALQEQHLATHDVQIKEIQAKQQALTDSSDFFSVLAFANLHNIGLTNGQFTALS